LYRLLKIKDIKMLLLTSSSLRKNYLPFVMKYERFNFNKIDSNIISNNEYVNTKLKKNNGNIKSSFNINYNNIRYLNNISKSINNFPNDVICLNFDDSFNEDIEFIPDTVQYL